MKHLEILIKKIFPQTNISIPLANDYFLFIINEFLGSYEEYKKNEEVEINLYQKEYKMLALFQLSITEIAKLLEKEKTNLENFKKEAIDLFLKTEGNKRIDKKTIDKSIENFRNIQKLTKNLNRIKIYPYKKIQYTSKKSVKETSLLIAHFRDACVHHQIKNISSSIIMENINKQKKNKKYTNEDGDIETTYHLSLRSNKKGDLYFRIGDGEISFDTFKEILLKTLTIYIQEKNPSLVR